MGRVRDTGANTETLTLEFDTTVKLTDLLFRNRDLGVFVGTLMINGTPFTTNAAGELTSAALALLGAADTFNFFSLTGGPTPPG